MRAVVHTVNFPQMDRTARDVQGEWRKVVVSGEASKLRAVVTKDRP